MEAHRSSDKQRFRDCFSNRIAPHPVQTVKILEYEHTTVFIQLVESRLFECIFWDKRRGGQKTQNT